MYFKERIISGVLCWQDTPDGPWTPYTIEQLSKLAKERGEQVYQLKNVPSSSGATGDERGDATVLVDEVVEVVMGHDSFGTYGMVHTFMRQCSDGDRVRVIVTGPVEGERGKT